MIDLKRVNNPHSRWGRLKISGLGLEWRIKLVYYDEEYLADRYGSQIKISTKLTRVRH